MGAKRLQISPPGNGYSPRAGQKRIGNDVEAAYVQGRLLEKGKGAVLQDVERAAHFYGVAAEQGHDRAACCLGVCYSVGRGVAQDWQKAAHWFRKAAELGNAKGMFNLGVCYEKGHGVPKDRQIALQWYELAADGGDVNAAFNLGVFYSRVRDWERAVMWYSHAAAAKDVDSMYRLGVCYANGFGLDAPDRRLSAKWFRRAAEGGNRSAAFQLGVYHANGLGVAKNWTKAMRWFEVAAQKGDNTAQFNLGVCYEQGKGTMADLTKAAQWYLQAALQGHALAQCNLGALYENGEGVEKDLVAATEWYQAAAKQGDATAQCNLGVMNATGAGGQVQDWEEAVRWFRAAAEHDDVDACCHLSACFAEGLGIAQDIEAAEFWHERWQQLKELGGSVSVQKLITRLPDQDFEQESSSHNDGSERERPRYDGTLESWDLEEADSLPSVSGWQKARDPRGQFEDVEWGTEQEYARRGRAKVEGRLKTLQSESPSSILDRAAEEQALSPRDSADGSGATRSEGDCDAGLEQTPVHENFEQGSRSFAAGALYLESCSKVEARWRSDLPADESSKGSMKGKSSMGMLKSGLRKAAKMAGFVSKRKH